MKWQIMETKRDAEREWGFVFERKSLSVGWWHVPRFYLFIILLHIVKSRFFVGIQRKHIQTYTHTHTYAYQWAWMMSFLRDSLVQPAGKQARVETTRVKVSCISLINKRFSTKPFYAVFECCWHIKRWYQSSTSSRNIGYYFIKSKLPSSRLSSASVFAVN